MINTHAERRVPAQVDPKETRSQFAFAEMRILAVSGSCDCDCDCDAGDIDNY